MNDLTLSVTAQRALHRKKKVWKFPVSSLDVTTKLSLGGNFDVITELFLLRRSLVSDIPAGDGKLVNLFLRCSRLLSHSGRTNSAAIDIKHWQRKDYSDDLTAD